MRQSAVCLALKDCLGRTTMRSRSFFISHATGTPSQNFGCTQIHHSRSLTMSPPFSRIAYATSPTPSVQHMLQLRPMVNIMRDIGRHSARQHNQLGRPRTSQVLICQPSTSVGSDRRPSTFLRTNSTLLQTTYTPSGVSGQQIRIALKRFVLGSSQLYHM